MKAMIPPSEIIREGCTLRFWLTGPAERPLIVFTHGAGIDHREWEDTLTLVAQELRVLCWDVRGHGQSAGLQPISPRFSPSPYTCAVSQHPLFRPHLIQELGF